MCLSSHRSIPSRFSSSLLSLAYSIHWSAPCVAKIADRIFDKADALVYHLVYHHSIAIHVNHLIFLNVILCSTCGILKWFGGFLPSQLVFVPCSGFVGVVTAYALQVDFRRGLPYVLILLSIHRMVAVSGRFACTEPIVMLF